jgi:4-amino-4-deoxy-L-arabinose transferase-like glycosyltransferase
VTRVSPFLLKKNLAILLLIFLLGFVLRVWRLGYVDFLPDEGHYAYDAFQVYKHNPGMVCRFHMQYHYSGQLGHPCLAQYLMAVSYRIFQPSVFSARFVSALAGSLIIPLIYLISGSIFAQVSTGLIAASLYAVFPLAVRFDRTTYLDTLQTFMLAVVLAIFIKFSRSKKIIYPILLGMATALLLLTKLSAPLIFIFLLINFSLSFFKKQKTTLIRYLFVFLGFMPIFYLGANPWAYLRGILHPTDSDFSFSQISFSFLTFSRTVFSRPFVTLIPAIFLVFVILGVFFYIKNKKPAFFLICLLAWLPLAGLFIIGHPNLYRLLPLVFLGSFFAADYLNNLKPKWKTICLLFTWFWFSYASIKWGILEINKITPLDDQVLISLSQLKLNKSDQVYLYQPPNNYFYWENRINFYLDPTWQNAINKNFKCVVSADQSQEGQRLNNELINGRGYSIKKTIANNQRKILIICRD